mmetsp:Transcript_38295/g.64315  ORF Transcript_38295/g.64315 Transcript_38295/m.64315 type:complete len:209 (-) Transcript_38295:843-1469(-)
MDPAAMATPAAMVTRRYSFSTGEMFLSVAKSMRGGKMSVRAVQDTPPTRPSSLPKDGMAMADQAARMTKADLNPYIRGADMLSAPPITLSMIWKADEETMGNVQSRLKHSRSFTTAAAVPDIMVMTTEETPAPKAAAPKAPNAAATMVLPANALAAELKNSFGCAMDHSMGGMVKCTKNRNATDPNAAGKPAAFITGIDAKLKPSWEA